MGDKGRNRRQDQVLPVAGVQPGEQGGQDVQGQLDDGEGGGRNQGEEWKDSERHSGNIMI